MKAWWQQLSAREKALILVAGGGLLLFILLQGVMMPAGKRLDVARQRYEKAVRDQRAVEAALAMLPALPAQEGATAPGDPEALSLLLTQRAQERGIAIARIGRGRNGEISVQIDSIAPQTLFGWLVALQQGEGISVATASLSAIEGSATVRATLSFAGDMP